MRENKNIINLIENEIKNDRIINQQITAIENFGLSFKDFIFDVIYKKEDIQVFLGVENAFFNNSFLKSKEINNIDFIYKDYKININSLTFENEKKLINSYKNTLEELEKQERITENEEKEIIKKQISKIKEKNEETESQKKKLIKETEITINEQLKDLKKDIENLKYKIIDMLEKIEKKPEKSTIRQILKNFKNERAKETIKRDLYSSYNLIIYNKKFEIIRINQQIKQLYLSISLSKAHLILSIIDNINTFKIKKEILKEEMKRLKNFKKTIKEEINEIVEEETEFLILEQIKDEVKEEDITISKIELYKLTIPRYKKLISKMDLLNV